MRDLYSNISCQRALSPVSVADNTAQVSQIIDRAGYDSLCFVIALGSIADADVTFTVLIEDGDNSALSDNAAVVDAELNGLESAAAFQFDSDNLVRKIGYAGAKRYVRMTITPANNASAALLSAVAILANPQQLPLS